MGLCRNWSVLPVSLTCRRITTTRMPAVAWRKHRSVLEFFSGDWAPDHESHQSLGIWSDFSAKPSFVGPKLYLLKRPREVVLENSKNMPKALSHEGGIPSDEISKIAQSCIPNMAKQYASKTGAYFWVCPVAQKHAKTSYGCLSGTPTAKQSTPRGSYGSKTLKLTRKTVFPPDIMV